MSVPRAPDHYRYVCSSCGRAWPPDAVRYLAPCCGRHERNRPLEGVLLVEYDYAGLRRRLDRRRFLRLPPGRPWLYPALWPLARGAKGAAGGCPAAPPAGAEREGGAMGTEARVPPEPWRARGGAMGTEARVPPEPWRARGGAAPAGPRVASPALLESLALPALPPAPADPAIFDGQPVWLQDESANPTFSFKDRASILVGLKALELGVREVAAASTGNAASSLAGISARLGLTAHLWVPAAAPAAKLLQMQAYGARVYPVEGSYDEAFDLCLQAAESRGWLNRNTAYHPLTLEGKKSAAFDLFIGFRGRLPDWIVVPVGDGVIIAGLHKGFGELAALGWIDRLPRLLAVQAAGSDALCRYLDTGRFDWRPAETAADSIAAGAPRALYLAARAVRESEGRAIRVSDEEILAAQALAASRLGRLVEPAAAASLAGLLRLQREGALNPKQRVLLLLTGNGLKDAASLARWIRPPEAHPAAEWRRLLGLEAD